MFKTYKLLGIFLLLASCSSFNSLAIKKHTGSVELKYKEVNETDFILHLESLGQSFLNTPGVKKINIDKNNTVYLEKIYNKILKNNELLLSYKENPQFIIIDDKTPFHFSLPHAKIFISTGLILKHIKSENILVAILACEIIKSLKNIFPKKRVVPIGVISLKKILNLVRLDLDTRKELNKWSFYVLRRAGYDPISYLNWIQIQNKNIIDFLAFNPEILSISQEEYAMRGFIVEEKKIDFDSPVENSSREFYQFLNFIKGNGQ